MPSRHPPSSPTKTMPGTSFLAVEDQAIVDELLGNIRTNLRIRTWISAFFIPSIAILQWIFHLQFLPLLFVLLVINFFLSGLYFFIYLYWPVFRTPFSLSMASMVTTVVDMAMIGTMLFSIGGFIIGGILVFPLYIIYAYLVYPFRWQSHLVLAATMFYLLTTTILEFFKILVPQRVVILSGDLYQDPAFIALYLVIALGLLFFIGLYGNIFSNKLREKSSALQVERNQLDAVFSRLPEGVIVFDALGKILFLNTPAEDVLGGRGGELVGKTAQELPQLEATQSARELIASWVSGQWDGKEREISTPGSAPRIFHASATEIKVAAQRHPAASIIILRDITREHFINRMKSEFIALAAHQLRTPLAAAKWALHPLLEGEYGKLTEAQHRVLEGGYRANERMIRLVADFLDVARMEEGRFGYQFVQERLEPLVERTVDLFRPEARKRDVEISIVTPPNPFPALRIDPDRINMVLENLLENAILYNH